MSHVLKSSCFGGHNLSHLGTYYGRLGFTYSAVMLCLAPHLILDDYDALSPTKYH